MAASDHMRSPTTETLTKRATTVNPRKIPCVWFVDSLIDLAKLINQQRIRRLSSTKHGRGKLSNAIQILRFAASRAMVALRVCLLHVGHYRLSKLGQVFRRGPVITSLSHEHDCLTRRESDGPSAQSGAALLQYRRLMSEN